MALGLFGVFGGATALGFGAVAVFLGVALLSPKLVAPLAALVGRPLERVRGVPARIAHENSVRNPGRTASTAAALMIGLALVSFVAIFAAGLKGSIDDAIEESISADLFLANTDGFSDIPSGSGDEVAQVDGVAAASPLRYTQYGKPGGEDGGSMTLIDPDGAAGVLTLDWRDGGQELLTEMGPEDAVLDEKFADEEGLEVGDIVPRGHGVRRGDRLHGHRDLRGQDGLHRRLRRIGRQREGLRRGADGDERADRPR